MSLNDCRGSLWAMRELAKPVPKPKLRMARADIGKVDRFLRRLLADKRRKEETAKC